MRASPWSLLLVLPLAVSACGDEASPASVSCPPGTNAAPEAAVCLSGDPDARWVLDQIQADALANDLRAVVFGVRRGGETLAVGAIGESADGVPATPDMHFRAGNISAGFLTTTVLQLVEEGKLRIDDPLSRWFPDLPDADRITIEMLASSTAGYLHFPNLEDFVAEFYADPFRTWTANELIAFGTADGTQFPPGTS